MTIVNCEESCLDCEYVGVGAVWSGNDNEYLSLTSPRCEAFGPTLSQLSADCPLLNVTYSCAPAAKCKTINEETEVELQVEAELNGTEESQQQHGQGPNCNDEGDEAHEPPVVAGNAEWRGGSPWLSMLVNT